MTNGCFQRLILSGALLLLPFTALAQNLATGTITGVVRDDIRCGASRRDRGGRQPGAD